jgi:hypothetical protein
MTKVIPKSPRGKLREIRLPCHGITIRLRRNNSPDRPGSGSISSNLKGPSQTAADRLYNAAIDGLESLILAHACAGIDVESPAYLEGIETAADALANQFQ